MNTVPRPFIKPVGDWDQLRSGFEWHLPENFNIAEACCDYWAEADPDRLAIRQIEANGNFQDKSYRDLFRDVQKLANVLLAFGISRGDRVGIILPQGYETAVAHLAIYRLGAIAVPLFTLFGADALEFRLHDSGTRAVVTDCANAPKLHDIRDRLPDLGTVFLTDAVRDHGADEIALWPVMERASAHCACALTHHDDPALISYTSGTTGAPKGALHAHRVLLGHLPGVELSHRFLGQAGDRFWTPADWAWMGGLMNVALPGLMLSIPVIAHRMAKFDPEFAADLMRRHEVRNTFLPPTALKMMRQAGLDHIPGLRSVASGGEALGAQLLDWGRSVFDLTINEFYGQTECNLVLANCADILPVRAGAVGRAVPGHDVAIIDDTGQVLPNGTPGEIAMRRPDPVMFLEYWNAPEKTAEKFAGNWLRTGDEAMMDDAGYVYFQSRSDDVITSAGYRIGPTEIEDCLVGHPAVALAAAIGVPDPVRTEIVKVFVVLRDGVTQDGLDAELIRHVRTRISPHVAPRSVEFVNSLPMTATGKIMRRQLRDLN